MPQENYHMNNLFNFCAICEVLNVDNATLLIICLTINSMKSVQQTSLSYNPSEVWKALPCSVVEASGLNVLSGCWTVLI